MRACARRSGQATKQKTQKALKCLKEMLYGDYLKYLFI
jgi:hypothetical protein